MREQCIYASRTVRLPFLGSCNLLKRHKKYAAAENGLGDMHEIPGIRLCLKEENIPPGKYFSADDKFRVHDKNIRAW